MELAVTYFGSSGWLLELGNSRVLIDPWLVGDLTFPPGSWLIEGKLKEELKPPNNIDLLLLTQGLADHAHPPTLRVLNREIPVIASPSGARVVEDLCFENITCLNPGESCQVKGNYVQATAGAKVPNTENGYIIRGKSGSIYIEPHGFLDNSIATQEIDAVITPVVNLKLPLAGSFIKGKTVLPHLIKKFDPLTVLASTTGGDATFSGLINNFINSEGSSSEASEYIGEKRTFIDPIILKKYRLKTRV